MREDPENNEIRSVKRHVSFLGKDVLEMGCGDGRVTMKYWNEPRSLVAIDPEEEAVKIAQARVPSQLSNKVRFQVGKAENLKFSKESFDIVFFTWSLCCVQDTKKSLREAWKVLRPNGTLVNLMPDVVPTVDLAVIRTLGGKNAARPFSADAFSALVDAIRDGLFLPLKEERVFFEVYLDSIDDFVKWLPTATGPFNQEEFATISRKSLEQMKAYANSLKHGQVLMVRDILSVSSAMRRQ